MACPHPPRSSLLLVPLALLHLVALYLFTSGFLLTRMELPRTSACTSPLTVPAMLAFAEAHDHGPSSVFTEALNRWIDAGQPLLHSFDAGTTTSGCWAGKKFQRAILVLVDALRVDFLRQQMPELARLAQEQPGHARLHVFEADPPTTTLQRLKALTTGSMPTFVDVGSSWDSYRLSEDNIVDQLVQNGRTLVLMGDDTWLGLFPTQFTRAFPFPSFNVKDLHTVDNGVLQHLLPEVRSARYDVLVAHFLGVDHIGHRYRADHPTMKTKLQQIDEAIGDVIASMDNDTVLFVFGDHGMTPDGNHGGASSLETDAGLFVYSPRVLFPETKAPEPGAEPRLKQVDLVPSLALLMGVPIPYGNLGMVISSLFQEPYHDSSASQLLRRLDALHINAWQVQQYLHEYAVHSQIFETERMQALTADFLDADAILLDAKARGGFMLNPDDAAYDLIHRFEKVLHDSAKLCREKWTTFEVPAMVWGLVLLLAAVVFHAAAVLLLLSLSNTWPTRPAFVAGAVAGVVVEFGGGFAAASSQWPLRVFAGACTASLMVRTASALSGRSGRPSAALLVSLVLVVAYVEGHFSDSLVENEFAAAAYISSTLALALGVFTPNSERARHRVHTDVFCGVAASVCIRSMGEGIDFGPGTVTVVSIDQLLQTYGGLLGLLLSHTALQRGHKARQAIGVVQGVLVAVYWWLESVRPEAGWLLLYLPRCVYGVSLLSLVFLMLFPRREAGFIDSIRSDVSLLLASFAAPMLLLLGPRSPRVFLFGVGTTWFLSRLSLNVKPAAVMMWMLGLRMFFATGHRNVFSSLQMSSAFVGFDQFDFVRSGLMLVLNTFSGYAMSSLLLLLLFVLSPGGLTGLKQGSSLDSSMSEALSSLTLLHSVRAVLTMINALIQRRHLMVWEIFAPKFIFDCTTLVFVDVFHLLVIAAVNRLCSVRRGYSRIP